MWSAIHVALLCMIVNLSWGSRAAAPKGTKSCRTRGVLFIRPFILRANMKPERTYCRPGRADFWPKRVDFRLERADYRL